MIKYSFKQGCFKQPCLKRTKKAWLNKSHAFFMYYSTVLFVFIQLFLAYYSVLLSVLFH